MFMFRRRQFDLLMLVTLVVGLGLIVLTRVRPDVPVALGEPGGPSVATTPAPREGHPAPDFTLLDLTGQPVRLADLQGQVVLINIWASWCPPCRAEMPMIQASYEQYRDQGFTVLAVNSGEDAATVAGYMDASGLTFPALLDQDGTVSNAYQARVMPSSFFVDRAGVIRAVYRGPLARSVIVGTVEQLLAEAP
ncbi:TlpA disulfide reductase family protein [Candidatus Chloroploca sp. Khr17]|uniref:TlpA family protein disulfide reductase n=1 Tax=Candidatus Chloroploca sp. Khr17 TaxID=2496869 RepID=UPI001F107571|nr:TlpA disulfide reductase family protein [Candidatus Chloroploca sp. Khr17]